MSESDRAELQRRVRSQTAPARDAKRARIVLLSADGVAGREIAELVGCSEPTVILWRRRYEQRGLRDLEDAARSGRRRVVDAVKEHEVLAATLLAPPEVGVTHWSWRLLSRRVGLHFTQVARVWRKWEIQPWREETFKFSTDPQLEAKVRDVIGLYLHPPDNAVVLCVDEKSQIQALDGTQLMLPLRPGLPARRTHDYVRNGTTALFLSIIGRQAVHRGSFASVDDLITVIRTFIKAWNERCGPFTWTKSADDILDHCKPKNTLATGH